MIATQRHATLCRVLFAALALLLLAGPASTRAQEPAAADSLETALDSGLPGGDVRWNLTADRVRADHDARMLEAWGNVQMTQGENALSADHARYYEATGWVFLEGNVVVDWGTDHLEADSAEFDLKDKTGWLTNGHIFVAEPHLYFSGEHIEKHHGDTYSFTNATVTACDGDSPAWSLHSSEGEVTLEGYATLWNSRFNVKDAPVLYSPVLVLPVKRKRQSGLLVPEAGFSSRLGFYWNQPLYWAIDEESDLTLFENYMAKRGFMHGVEYRRTPDPDTQDLVRFDYLYDDVKDETERAEDEQFRGDDLTRANRNRYWWRSKHDGYLAGDPRWRTKLDIDWVSDQNYLREFKDGKSGYTQSRETFLERFRRDIASRDATERSSALLVQRSFDRVGVAAKAEITQNLQYMNGNREKTKNPSLQRLPELSAYVYKDYLLGTPLEFQFDSQAGEYWRQEGDRGARLDMHPSLSAPLSLGPVSIIPSAGLRATGYAAESLNGTAEDRDHLTARQIADLSVAAFTEVSKVYHLADAPDAEANLAGNSTWTRVRHAVQPRLAWDWVDSVDQSEKPFYDAEDRVPAVNELTYSLTNVLDRRRDTVTVRPGKDGEPDQAAITTDYLDFLRLRLAQGFDIREAQRTDKRDEYPRRPFNDAVAELTLQPGRWVGITSRTFYSPYLNSVTEHDHTLWVGPDDRNRATFGLDFRESVDEYKRRARERIRLVRLGLDLVVSRRWSTGFTYRADLESGEDLEKTLQARYSHQCFDVVFMVTQTPFEDRFEVRFELLGISF